MRLNPQITLSFLMPLTFGSVAVADEFDPFTDTPAAMEQQATLKEFVTTAAFKVAPVAGWDPESIPSEDWPKIENPTSFNRHFDRPFRIWRVDGGYFSAFDGGEWGGALFFATGGAPKWTRIIDTHIQDLERYEGDTFLATGGLAHLSLSGGAAYLITRLPTGEWQSRMVFSSKVGIPRVAGTSATEIFLKAESKKLIVLGLDDPMGREPFFGVDTTGAIHYLGERSNNQPSEPAGADHSATKPADKPPVKDQPSTPAPN
jgi:hypothetical protein